MLEYSQIRKKDLKMLQQLFKELEIAYNKGDMQKADEIYKEICKIERKENKKMKKELEVF